MASVSLTISKLYRKCVFFIQIMVNFRYLTKFHVLYTFQKYISDYG